MTVSEPSAAVLLTRLTDLIRTARCVAHQDHENDMAGTLTGILRLVAVHDVRPGDLATQLMVASSVASRAVAALEADGLVQRRPDPLDARACRIAITVRGEARLLERKRHGLLLLIDALPDWDDDEVADAAAVLCRLEHSLSAAATRPVPPAPNVVAGTPNRPLPDSEPSTV